MISYSSIESNRFGLKIYRGSQESLDMTELQGIMDRQSPDIIIFRIPCEYQYQIHQLNALECPIVVADTLVYYTADLNNLIPNKIKNADLDFYIGQEIHQSSVQELVNECFRDYTNHYFSNPLLDKKKILEGYQEWAVNYFDTNQKDRIAWLVEKKKQAVAFMTCNFSAKECEIILNGVKPTFEGQGIYSDLLRYTQDHFKAAGLQKMKISTQIQNYRVQKVWHREGFTLDRAYVTIHLNCMLTTGL
jgi:ribosomal protein S18 acetylase RimI-like enzyme